MLGVNVHNLLRRQQLFPQEVRPAAFCGQSRRNEHLADRVNMTRMGFRLLGETRPEEPAIVSRRTDKRSEALT
jgi:hypothetical protein